MITPSRSSEIYLIASFLADPALLPLAVSKGLSPASFTDPDAQAIAREVLSLSGIGAVAPESVRAALEARNKMTGDVEDFLAECEERRSLIDRSTFTFHLQDILNADKLREAHHALKSLSRTVYGDNALSLAERVKTLQEAIPILMAIGVESEDTLYTPEKNARRLESFVETLTEPDKINAIKTNMPSLDTVIGGLFRGRVSIVGAETSHGKTIFIIDLAMRIAMSGGRVLIFSAEMDWNTMNARQLAWLSRVDSASINMHTVHKSQLPKLREAAATLAELDISVDYETRPSNAYLSGQAQRLANDRPLDLIVMDYIEYTGETGQKTERLEKAMAGAHQVAKQQNAAFVMVSQLAARKIEARESGEPRLSDMRYAADLENMAAFVGLLYSEWQQNEQMGRNDHGVNDFEVDKDGLELFIRKNTNTGTVGKINLQIDRPTSRILDPMDTRQDYGNVH